MHAYTVSHFLLAPFPDSEPDIFQIHSEAFLHIHIHKHARHSSCNAHVPISPIHTQSEVASLAETSAQQQAAVFTPYLLPDALTLCTALHLIRKLLSSEKFIVVIAKSGRNAHITS